ncbi:MAG: hypothetical protein ACJ8EY_07865 [Sphingomicrobium sp.]
MILVAMLILTGCGSSGPVAKEAKNTAVIPANAVAGVAEPLPPPPDGSAPLSGEQPPAPPAAAITIPAFLHGRWGLTPADCTSTRGDAKGLLIVTADRLQFYESRALPTGNTNHSDDSFSADFTFTGEGQRWTRFETMQLQDKRLVRTTSNPMASYTYAKCS